MGETLRDAVLEDATWIVQQAEEEQARHRERHSLRDGDATAFRAPTRAEIEALIASDKAISLVDDPGTGRGFLLARLVNAPPVYAPGGPVCLVEAFGVAGERPDAGETLVEEAARRVRERGGVLLRIVCSHGDAARERFLADHGFTIASEWYVGATSTAAAAAPAVPGVIRPAEPSDLPRILQMSDRKRDQYATYQPVFWRKSPAPPETFAPYLGSVLANPRTSALVHEQDGTINGFLIAAGDYVDDTAVEPEVAWHTVGAALLRDTARSAAAKGIAAFTIVCANADTEKRKAIAASGFRLVTEWYVRDLI
jgi:hypothetical protein